MIVKLTRPIDVMGKPVDELSLDLDSVTGADLMAAYMYADAESKPGASAHSVALCVMVGSRACKISPPALLSLCAHDFNRIVVEVQPLLEASD